jgi:hypothetical protein
MKKVILIALVIHAMQTSFAQQKYYTKTGTVSFEAGTPLEDVDGLNKSATCVFDASTGQIEFALLVKGFEFTRALMQEHFNENYMESDKYPKSDFRGQILNIEKIDFQKDGIYPFSIKGTLEIHGVKKEIETTGTFNVKGGTIISSTEFSVLLEDYQIAIPGLVKDKISKSAKIKVTCNYAVLQ